MKSLPHYDGVGVIDTDGVISNMGVPGEGSQRRREREGDSRVAQLLIMDRYRSLLAVKRVLSSFEAVSSFVARILLLRWKEMDGALSVCLRRFSRLLGRCRAVPCR